MGHSNIPYRTTVEDEHWRNEEFQWARILSEGHAAKGMVLLYLQKVCTAFHEFEPAFKAGALDVDRLDFFRHRMANRLRQLVTTMQNNSLDGLNGASELLDLLHETQAAGSMKALSELTERLHQAGHTLLDALERA